MFGITSDETDIVMEWTKERLTMLNNNKLKILKKKLERKLEEVETRKEEELIIKSLANIKSINRKQHARTLFDL